MGMGWHVALEHPLPDLGPPTAAGKALLFAQHEVDELAERLNLQPITAFVSVNRAGVAEYLRREGLDPDALPLPEEEWFDAAEGLATVQGLRAHLRENPQTVTNGTAVLRDLSALEAPLLAAVAARLRFHLESDMPTLS